MDRFVRFLAFKPLFDLPLIGSFLNMMKMIPIDPSSPTQIKESMDQAREGLRNGELVCIFPEGMITRTGQIHGIRRGVEKLGQMEDVPVVPIHLDEVWGSIFSFESGRFFWKVPARIPYPVNVSFGNPLDKAVTRTDVREAIQILGAQSAKRRVHNEKLLPHKFIRTARGNFWRKAVVDSTQETSVRFGTLLVMVLAMRNRLNRMMNDQQRVGILLPPTLVGNVINIALSFLGITSVNLNYTTGQETLESAIRQSELDTVITSKLFLRKVELDIPEDVDMLEAQRLADDVSLLDKTRAFVSAFLPSRAINSLFCSVEDPDEILTVIFSSGSTGEPKGIKLSYANISANLESIQQVASFDGSDRMLGILPFFHSFGYTGTIWLPMVMGFGVIYHADPMDAREIGELMGKWDGSVIIATPTFLRLYKRRCTVEQFDNLRFVICGAEKLKGSLAKSFNEKFGVWPLEGYGCTELSPVISVNVPNVQYQGKVFQKGRKQGSVGRPLPGVAVRIVDPDSGERLEDGEEGLILTQGANRMEG
ncbi:MAG: AMP-binding protein, partial [bacterium]